MSDSSDASDCERCDSCWLVDRLERALEDELTVTTFRRCRPLFEDCITLLYVTRATWAQRRHAVILLGIFYRPEHLDTRRRWVPQVLGFLRRRRHRPSETVCGIVYYGAKMMAARLADAPGATLLDLRRILRVVRRLYLEFSREGVQPVVEPGMDLLAGAATGPDAEFFRADLFRAL